MSILGGEYFTTGSRSGGRGRKAYTTQTNYPGLAKTGLDRGTRRLETETQISRITGMISGRRCVFFTM
jgi:hypothetical protein